MLDARVGVGGGGDAAGDGDPVLSRAVLEGYLGGGVVGEVAEFVGVVVGEEEEVGAVTLEGRWMLVVWVSRVQEDIIEMVGLYVCCVPLQQPLIETQDRCHLG